MTISKQQLALAAAARLQQLRLATDFDARKPDSRPTAEQQEALDCICGYKVKNAVVVGGNRCLAEGTLVATKRGAVPIEELKVGDIVYDETGAEQYVEAWYDQGQREVVEVWANKRLAMECTPNHDLWVSKEKTNRKFFKIQASELETLARPGLGAAFNFTATIGNKDIPDAYVIGVMLGDGCCKESRKALCVSSEDSVIPNAVAEIVGANTVRRQHETNYTWLIRQETENGDNIKPDVSFNHWFSDLYAHEKFIDLTEIKTWNRQSLLRLLAGLIDTDGSVWQTKDGLRLGISMQAKSVIEAAQWILSSLWQCPTQLHEDERDKYKNGNVFYITVTNPWYVDKILRELGREIRCERKRWKPEYECEQTSRWVPWRRGGACTISSGKIAHVYDITVTGKNNVFLLANGVLTGNSGKSQMLRRLVAWFLREDEEAQWKRRSEWKGPLTGILVSKSHKQFEGSLLEAIIPFFEGDKDFKVIRNGHYIECLHYKKTGNTIWILVHENVGQCRERVQSFAAHMAFLDELPSGVHAIKLIEEIAARVTDYKGVFGSFFTPKSVNKPVRDWVESLEAPAGKKFSLSFMNNPGIDQEAKDMRLQELKNLPEHLKATVLSGSWMMGEDTVFTLTDEMIEQPTDYDPYLWRHVISVDPALNSQQGMVVCAERPSDGKWFAIFAKKYDKIIDADDGVEIVWKEIQKYRWNVLQIVYDPASTYWFKSAKKHPEIKKLKIVSPFNKNSTERKEEMLSNLQIALGTSLFIAPYLEDLTDEFYSCEWSATTPGKIKKGQKYHLLDAIRYFVDCMPKWGGVPKAPAKDLQQAHAQGIRESHEKWKAQEAKRGTTNWRGGGRIVGRGRIQLR